MKLKFYSKGKTKNCHKKAPFQVKAVIKKGELIGII